MRYLTKINTHAKLYIITADHRNKTRQKIPFVQKAKTMRSLPLRMPPTIATPTRSKGSGFCCGNSMYWFCVGSNRRQTWRTTIWNQEKLKYLLVSLRHPHETSQPYNSHREGQKTTVIQISAGPGKINPHVELVLRLSVLLALCTIRIAKIKPDLSFNGKQSWFIVHKILLNSTHGKKKKKAYGQDSVSKTP